MVQITALFKTDLVKLLKTGAQSLEIEINKFPEKIVQKLDEIRMELEELEDKANFLLRESKKIKNKELEEKAKKLLKKLKNYER